MALQLLRRREPEKVTVRQIDVDVVVQMQDEDNGDAIEHDVEEPVRNAEHQRRRQKELDDDRHGASDDHILVAQMNLSNTYAALGRVEEATRMMRDVYSGRLKLHGEEHPETARVANNYAMSLIKVQRFEEVKTLLRRTLPVARRVLGKYDTTTLASESIYAEALYGDPSATLGDVREAVTMLEELVPTARRVFGGAHPTTVGLGAELKLSRAALRARETPPTSG